MTADCNSACVFISVSLYFTMLFSTPLSINPAWICSGRKFSALGFRHIGLRKRQRSEMHNCFPLPSGEPLHAFRSAYGSEKGPDFFGRWGDGKQKQ